MVLIKTNKELIYRLSTDGLLRTYCHFLHWKALYKNGTIYGNALSNLSRKTRRSRTCLKHHIDIMIYEGIKQFQYFHTNLNKHNLLTNYFRILNKLVIKQLQLISKDLR